MTKSKNAFMSSISPLEIKVADFKNIKDMEDTPVSAKLFEEVYHHKADVDIDNKLSICCCERKTDKRLIQIGVQIALSFVILTFSFVQLILWNDPCDSGKEVYVSLISAVLSFWLAKKSSL